MYFVLRNNLNERRAIGPFLNRNSAYEYAAKQNWHVGEYDVKSDRVCQQNYLDFDIVKPG